MIDLALLAVLGVATLLVANEGAWSAAISLACVVLAGVLTMNLFEPAANFLGAHALTSIDWQARWDILCLLGIFAAGYFGLRRAAEKLFPERPQLEFFVEQFGRWGCGLLAGYVTMAIVLTSLHTAPLPREFLGFTAERANFFGMAPDRQWLGFTQYLSETSLRTLRADGLPRLFDGPVAARIPGNPSTNEVFSSFPIRYAARREQLHGGALVPVQAAPPPPPDRGSAAGND